MDDNILKFKKLSENAVIPVRSSSFSAGLDLFSAEYKIIPGQDCARIKTDIAVKMPYGTYGRIAPRSGLAAVRFIGLGGGVIDGDFTGNIECIVFNHGKDAFEVTKNMKIAQLIVEKNCYRDLLQVETLERTERGEKGFGSSGY